MAALTQRELAALEALDVIAVRLRSVHLLLSRELDSAILEAEHAMREAHRKEDK